MINIIYHDFIKNILTTRGRFECGNEYHERHHIVPKCLGGTDEKDNLIDLYAKEHFIAHKLIANENPNNSRLVLAYCIMAFTKNKDQIRYELTPEEYEEARIALSKTRKELYKDKRNHPSYGKHISEDRKIMIGRTNKGNKYCVGRKVRKETREKISKANKNPSKETREKMSKARNGKNLRSDNPNSKSVVRIYDGKVYKCMKDAAIENDINYSTFKGLVNKRKKFMYYKDWIKLEKL